MSFIFNSKYNSQSRQVEINKNNIEELQKQNFTIYNTQLELTQDSTTIAVTQTDIDLNNIGNALLMSRNGLLFKIVTIEQGNAYLRYYANVPQGPQGLTGTQGPKGEQGVKGDTGATGPQGPKGEQGIQGLKGDTGPAGPIGPQGPQGEQGIQGIQGPQGIQGNKGDKGDNGNDFTIQGYVSSTASLPQNYTSADIGKAYLVGVTTPRVVYLWGYNEQGELIWSNQGYLQGPQGEQGPQGVQGVQGEQGVQGLQGVQGEQGPKGDTGDTGPQGPQGPAGIQGPKGDTGLQGPQGPQGPQGDPGEQGPQGDIGATPNISVSATSLPAGSEPTATRSGTDANPTITFGIPNPLQFKTIDMPITNQPTTTTLTSGNYFDQGYKYRRTYFVDTTNLIGISKTTIFNYTFKNEIFGTEVLFMTSNLTYGKFNSQSYTSLKGLQGNDQTYDNVSEVIIVPTSMYTGGGSTSGAIAVYCRTDTFNNYSGVRLNYLD